MTTLYHCEMRWEADGDDLCWCGLHASPAKPADWPKVHQSDVPSDVRIPNRVEGLTGCWQAA